MSAQVVRPVYYHIVTHKGSKGLFYIRLIFHFFIKLKHEISAPYSTVKYIFNICLTFEQKVRLIMSACNEQKLKDMARIVVVKIKKNSLVFKQDIRL